MSTTTHHHHSIVSNGDGIDHGHGKGNGKGTHGIEMHSTRTSSLFSSAIAVLHAGRVAVGAAQLSVLPARWHVDRALIFAQAPC
jgi:hypothetical protein